MPKTTDIRQIEHALKSFAEAESFGLVTIFHEHVPGSRAVFGKLIKELQRAQAHDVVIPSLQHLARHPLVRISMLTYTEVEARPACTNWMIGNRHCCRTAALSTCGHVWPGGMDGTFP